MNKLCDAADWADPEFLRIVTDELADVPRFHRKQWEFAQIYRALLRLGVLHERSEGISFGSATEVMLYSVARRVGHLWATDLYAADATWDIARTSDPTELVRSKAPFSYPPERLSARSMDMREVAFPNESFDFAYSSCAIEHIGARDDFIRHLREVARVLRPGGVYAFTTELTYADATVEMPGNFYFSRRLLEEIVRESGLWCDPRFDASLQYHRANTPLPLEFASGVFDGDGEFTERLFGLMSVVQLTCATVPFTSCLVVLQKNGQRFDGWHFDGWDETRRFIDQGLDLMRSIVERAELRPAPFAWMSNRKSRHYLGHHEFFERTKERVEGGCLFHTGYFWLGGRPRPVRVSILPRSNDPFALRLKVHRCPGSAPWKAELDSYIDIPDVRGPVFKEFMLDPSADHVYAILGELISGQAELLDVSITHAPAGSRLLPIGA